MNCQSCTEKSEAYLGGILSESEKAQIEEHLKKCPSCSEAFRLLDLAGRVIDEEKSLESNPFLKTRIMAAIDRQISERESVQSVSVFQRVIRPVVISLSVAAAAVLGVMAGSTLGPADQGRRVPVELVYINDAAIESVNLFLND